MHHLVQPQKSVGSSILTKRAAPFPVGRNRHGNIEQCAISHGERVDHRFAKKFATLTEGAPGVSVGCRFRQREFLQAGTKDDRNGSAGIDNEITGLAVGVNGKSIEIFYTNQLRAAVTVRGRDIGRGR